MINKQQSREIISYRHVKSGKIISVEDYFIIVEKHIKIVDQHIEDDWQNYEGEEFECIEDFRQDKINEILYEYKPIINS